MPVMGMVMRRSASAVASAESPRFSFPSISAMRGAVSSASNTLSASPAATVATTSYPSPCSSSRHSRAEG